MPRATGRPALARRDTALALALVSRRGWLLFLSLGVIWGVPYLLIKVAVTEVEPSFVVFMRVTIGALVLLPVVAARRQFGSLRGHWRWVVVFALVELTFTLLALGWAEMRISSSLAALLIASVPIVGAVLARRFGLDDRLTGGRVVGLAVGFLGVACLVGLDVEGGNLLAVVALAVTVLGYSLGPIVIEKRLSDVPSLPVVAAALGVNALIYAPIAWFTHPTQPVSASAWASMIVLGVLCSAVAFVMLFALIAEVGAPRAQVITYINPAVAVVLGVLVLHEPITLGIAIGFPLVLVGSWLATRSGPFVEAEPHA
jgi:drug/metabolite transporter (DMT)-like permease